MRYRKNPGQLLIVNPSDLNPRGYDNNPKRKRHHYKRNPLDTSHLGAMTKNAGVAAAGALGINFIFNSFGATVLPATLTSGAGSYLTKAALAYALGIFGKGKPMLMLAAEGALTVALADLVRSYAAASGMTSLSGAGWLSPGIRFNPPNMPLKANLLTNALGAAAVGKVIRLPQTPAEMIRARRGAMHGGGRMAGFMAGRGVGGGGMGMYLQRP
jgi:hypothetical protein